MGILGKTTVTKTQVNIKTQDTVHVEVFPVGRPDLHLKDIPREEGEKRIYNLIILDESGSMICMYRPAMDGTNATFETIRKAQKEHPEGKQFVTFVTFDSGSREDDVRAVIPNKPVDELVNINKDMYRPGGGTPLYDAIGTSLDNLEPLVKEGDEVLVTIITDGEENSSIRYSASMVKEMIEGLRAKGWVFSYIGANQDSVEVAGDLGINNAMDFRQDEVGSAMMFDKLNSSREAYYRRVDRKRRGEQVELEEDFFHQKRGADRVTPEHVSVLGSNEVLVLGSSIERGLHGNKYYIQTEGMRMDDVASQVEDFIYFAERSPISRFLVTRVGCGHAGFTDQQIAPLFARAYSLEKIALPASFWRVLDYRF